MTDHAASEARVGLPSPRLPGIAPSRLILAALWLGTLSGLGELGVLAARNALGARVTMELLWQSNHSVWMIPACDAMLFALMAAILSLVGRLRPRLLSYWAGPILAAMALGAIVERVPGLHSAARVVLACGLGFRLGRLATNHRLGFARLVRFSLPIVALVAAVGGPLAYLGVVRGESRALAALPPARPGSPNVLLLVMDTVRADHLSHHGYHRNTSPNLARLADEAVRFERARSTAPWTLPSHASMMTGRWASELSTRVDRPLDATFPTLGEYLGSLGYATAGFVANTYYCNSAYGLDRGFARYEDFPEKDEITPLEFLRSSSLGRHLADVLNVSRRKLPGEKGARKSAAQINDDFLAWSDRRGDRPFFAFLNYYDAHDPYQPPDGYARRFDTGRRSDAEREAILSEYLKIARNKKKGPVDPKRDQEIIQQARDILRDSYDECIASLDAEIGRLFAELDRRGLRDDTIVLLTADHGEHFGEHDLFGHGVSLYEPEVHVPLLVFAPGAPKGKAVAEPVSLRDLSATVADLVGRGTDHAFPGRSLAGRWSGAKVPGDPIIVEVEQQKKFAPTPTIPASLGPMRGLIVGSWVYIRGGDGERLFDLAKDPQQARNLSGSSDVASVLLDLRANLEGLERGRGMLDTSRVARDAGAGLGVIRK